MERVNKILLNSKKKKKIKRKERMVGNCQSDTLKTIFIKL